MACTWRWPRACGLPWWRCSLPTPVSAGVSTGSDTGLIEPWGAFWYSWPGSCCCLQRADQSLRLFPAQARIGSRAAVDQLFAVILAPELQEAFQHQALDVPVAVALLCHHIPGNLPLPPGLVAGVVVAAVHHHGR